MLGENDNHLFLVNDHFSEDVALSSGAIIRGIFDHDDDPQFAGMVEGRDPSVLVATSDYLAHGIRHRDTITLKSQGYMVETVEPYGADREYTVLRLRES